MNIELVTLIDLGIESAQYFQGYSAPEGQKAYIGSAQTKWDAIEDAFESAAQDDHVLPELASFITNSGELDVCVCNFLDCDVRAEEECQDCETHYYVALLVPVI